MGWGQSRSGGLADRLATLGVNADYTPITGAAPMLDEALDVTQPHTACDQRIARLASANEKLRADLRRAIYELGRDETTGAIRKYGHHLSYCPVITRGSDCECGLDRWTA